MPHSIDAAKLATDPVWVERVRVLAVKTAVAVLAEDPQPPSDMSDRQQYARRVLDDPGAAHQLALVIAAVMPAITANAAANQEIPDSDIEWALAAVWSQVSRRR